MKKYGMLAVCFLAAISFSNLVVAQAPSSPDVAQLLYKIIKQQIVVKKAYKDLIAATDNYISDPTDSSYKDLKTAIGNDLKATKDYDAILANTNEADIEKAEKMFYQETPALKSEIEKSTPDAKGETVEKRMGEPERSIEEALTVEMGEGGGQSPFALALQNQAAQLQSVQKRIAREQNSPVVQSNPSAQKQDRDLQSALNDAIQARMSVVFCAQNSLKDCCKKYPSNPKCIVEKNINSESSEKDMSNKPSEKNTSNSPSNKKTVSKKR